MALQELPKRHAALHQDPVAQREHRAWLVSAEGEALQLIRALLGQPEAESLHWFWGGKERLVTSRRHLQWQLSDWVEKIAYPQAPLLRNELINRDHPSASANTGRKRLLAAMLSAPGEESLGIAKTPAEKSLYLSLLQESGLHRKQNGRLGFHPPNPSHDPCNVNPVWEAMTRLLGDHGERQIALPELYATLTGRPFGLKLGVLLFDALPQALGLNPADLTMAPGEVIEGFVQHLVGVLRELNKAYPALLIHWQGELNRTLLDTEAASLAALRRALAGHYGGLERYTPDRMGVGALARRFADTAHVEDQAWLESVATLVGRMPPQKWREDTRVQAELRLREMAQQLRDLESLRLTIANGGVEGAVLLKVVDVEGGERSRVVQLSATQRAKAAERTEGIAQHFDGLDEAEKLAVVAELIKLFTP